MDAAVEQAIDRAETADPDNLATLTGWVVTDLTTTDQPDDPRTADRPNTWRCNRGWTAPAAGSTAKPAPKPSPASKPPATPARSAVRPGPASVPAPTPTG
ncbi:hypothetical protein GCM10011354_29690 [Egicoccus halophilus]|uniref:Uncharacterized protein n=1 Tax=Egicoccus halophilus TaxID=1670830 RepID=A0A8J3AHC5_9ACTN|nr:hypothetical protein GCM10011354_29690 [Egicoccus halophilus]